MRHVDHARRVLTSALLLLLASACSELGPAGRPGTTLPTSGGQLLGAEQQPGPRVLGIPTKATIASIVYAGSKGLQGDYVRQSFAVTLDVLDYKGNPLVDLPVEYFYGSAFIQRTAYQFNPRSVVLMDAESRGNGRYVLHAEVLFDRSDVLSEYSLVFGVRDVSTPSGLGMVPGLPTPMPSPTPVTGQTPVPSPTPTSNIGGRIG